MLVGNGAVGSKNEAPPPPPSSSSSSSMSLSSSLSSCLAGLGMYTEGLCALCEAGTRMSALWSENVAQGGSGENVAGERFVQKVCAVLRDLHSLAELEKTQISMCTSAAIANTDHTQHNTKVTKLLVLPVSESAIT